MGKIQGQRHITQRSRTISAKVEKCSVKTAVLHQYLMKLTIKVNFSLVKKLEILNNYGIWKTIEIKLKKESSNKSGVVDRIFTAMELEQSKSVIRNVTILPQLYLVFVLTDDCLEGVESCCISSNSMFRCITIFEKHTNYE